jgi:predicted metal-binding membrane protein
MSMVSPAMAALATVAMMIAMMLPSIAPTLWRHHRHLRALGTARAGRQTTLFALGYAAVWSTVGLALFAVTPELSAMGTASPADRPFALWAAGAVVLCIGALQRSRWKAKHLLRCGHMCVAPLGLSNNIMTAWRNGYRLGIDCVSSCAAPMAVLLVAGPMDMRMMTMITAAITAERVAPGGARIARLTGAFALFAGFFMCLRAIGVTISGIA